MELDTNTLKEDIKTILQRFKSITIYDANKIDKLHLINWIIQEIEDIIES